MQPGETGCLQKCHATSPTWNLYAKLHESFPRTTTALAFSSTMLRSCRRRAVYWKRLDFGQVMQTIDVNRLWSSAGRPTVSAFAPSGTSEADCQHLVRSREHSRLRTNRLVRLLHVEGRFEHAVADPVGQLPCSAGRQSSSRAPLAG